MSTRRCSHRFTAWLAALAVLLGALMPVLSHAVAAHQVGSSGWVEVCTATGMAWVKSADDVAATSANGQQEPASVMVMTECDWCATHSPHLGALTVAQPLTAPLAFGPDVPMAFLHAPRPLFVWATAHSRAPPISA